MTTTRMIPKKINLGQGFVYYEVVKPSRATIHQLQQYLHHEECGVMLGGAEGRFTCWNCGIEAPQDVIEKGMTILSMRVM